MNAFEILRTMAEAGIDVTVDGDRLRVSPSSLLTDELRGLIREHKTALIAAVVALRDRVDRLLDMGAIDEEDAVLVRHRYFAYPEEWDLLLDACERAVTA